MYINFFSRKEKEGAKAQRENPFAPLPLSVFA
jgi:hypothetical protein